MEKANMTTEQFKKELSQVEKEGMKSIISAKFESEIGFDPVPNCYFTKIGDHYGLTYQDNETQLESGITLSSFAMTHLGEVVAVCLSDEDEYVFYLLK